MRAVPEQFPALLTFPEAVEPGECARRHSIGRLLFRNFAETSAAGHAARLTQRQTESLQHEGQLRLRREAARDEQGREVAVADEGVQEDAAVGGEQGLALVAGGADQV